MVIATPPKPVGTETLKVMNSSTLSDLDSRGTAIREDASSGVPKTTKTTSESGQDGAILARVMWHYSGPMPPAGCWFPHV